MCNALAMPKPQPMSSSEVCSLLGINRSTLSRWVARDLIVPVMQLPHDNGAMLFDRADVEALASKRGAA